MATCIFYRNGRLSGRDNEVLARSKRQHYYKPRILGSKKKLWLKIHSSSCILLLFYFLRRFPALDGVWSVGGGATLPAPLGPLLRRPSLGRRRRRWHGNSRGHNCRTFFGCFLQMDIILMRVRSES